MAIAVLTNKQVARPKMLRHVSPRILPHLGSVVAAPAAVRVVPMARRFIRASAESDAAKPHPSDSQEHGEQQQSNAVQPQQKVGPMPVQRRRRDPFGGLMATPFDNLPTAVMPFGRLSSYMREMQREMDSLMSRALPEDMMALMGPDMMMAGPAALPSALRLPFDAHETDKAFELVAEVPGFSKGDIKVHLEEDGTLVVDAQKKVEKVEKEEQPQEGEEGSATRRLYASRSFYQRLRLPEGVSADGIKATTKDGVLTVTLPKAPKAEPKRKEIPVA